MFAQINLAEVFSMCFSPQTVGVIVRLEKDNFQVLNMFSKVSVIGKLFVKDFLMMRLSGYEKAF